MGVLHPDLLLLPVIEHGEGLHDHGCPVVQAEALVHLPPSRDVVEVDEVCLLKAIVLIHVVLEHWAKHSIAPGVGNCS